MSGLNPREQVRNWIDTVITRPHEEFGGFPVCPFARASETRICVGRSIRDLRAILDAWDDSDCVVAFVHLMRPTYRKAFRIADSLNRKYEGKDLVVLTDHPDEPLEFNGFRCSNGKYVLFLVQRLSRVNQATMLLSRSSTYYDSWSEENKNAVVRSRFGRSCPI
jgi:hypothetical protein